MSFEGRIAAERRARGGFLSPLVDGGGKCHRALFRHDRIEHENGLLLSEIRRDQDAGTAQRLFDAVASRDLTRLAAERGDYALAFVDTRNGSLILGLAPLSELELHYRVDGDGAVRFGTELNAVLGNDPPDLDPLALAEALQFPAFVDGDRAVYAGVRHVAPGTTVEVVNRLVQVERFWDARRVPRRPISLGDAGSELRSRLEASVAARLRAVEGPKGTLLSAGRDSSAVTAVTAGHLFAVGDRLSAWTAAAEAGAVEDCDVLLDEASVAECTAARHPNVDHHVIRPARFDLCQRLDDLHRAVDVPILQPLALAWCEQLWDACDRTGVRLLLSGDFGNYALSAGGLVYLEDVRRESGTIAWLLATVAILAGSSFAECRSLAGAMLGWRWQSRTKDRPGPMVPFLRGDLADAYRRATYTRPTASGYREWLSEGLNRSIGPNDVVGLGRTLEMTDPTRDRDVVELVLGLPANMLASPNRRRPIFEAAFGAIVSKEVMRPTKRGRQNVDWAASYKPDDMKRHVARYRMSKRVTDWIDVDFLLGALDRWPKERTLGGPVYREMVWGVLPAVAMASFLYTREH